MEELSYSGLIRPNIISYMTWGISSVIGALLGSVVKMPGLS